MTFKRFSYRQLQIKAKKLDLKAFGKRQKIIGRITMYHFWKNKKEKMIRKFNYFQAALIQMIYMVWFYLILHPSKNHSIRPLLSLKN
jgi:hypothetical protein